MSEDTGSEKLEIESFYKAPEPIVVQDVLTREKARDIGARFIAEGYKLIGDRIGFVREAPETKTRGGLYIPDDAKRRLLRGRIVAIGAGVITDESQAPKEGAWNRQYLGLAVGDYVTFTKYGGQLFEAVWSDGTIQELEVCHAADIYIVSR